MYPVIKTSVWLSMVALVLAATTGIGHSVIVDRIVARVNNDIITLSELKETAAEVIARMEEELGDAQGEELKQKIQAIESEVLNKLVENRLIVYHAKNIGIVATEEEITKTVEGIKKQNSMDDLQFNRVLKQEGMTLEEYRKKIKDQLLVSRTFQLEVKSNIQVSDQEVQEYYEQHKERYLIPEEITLQQILFLCPKDADPLEEDRAKAQAHYVRDKLMEGEDFAELARKHSQDPSAAKGGELGSFKRKQLLPALEEASFQLDAGEVSPVVRTSFGFHILKAVEKKEIGYRPLAILSEDLRRQILEEKNFRLHQEWIKKLYKESFVEVLYP